MKYVITWGSRNMEVHLMEIRVSGNKKNIEKKAHQINFWACGQVADQGKTEVGPRLFPTLVTIEK